jgi:hypothetical protein
MSKDKKITDLEKICGVHANENDENWQNANYK